MSGDIRFHPTPWKAIILLCGKCARKLDGGFGPKGKDALRTMLRGALKANGHGRDIRIIETRCMGVCPKRAVAAVDARCPNKIFVVPKGTSEQELLDLIEQTPK